MLLALGDATGTESWPLVGLLGRASLVVLAMVLVLWLWRRSQQRLPSGQLQVIEQQRLSATHTLYLVRLGNRQLLLGAAPSGLSLLCEIDPQRPSAEPLVTPPPASASSVPAWIPAPPSVQSPEAHGGSR